MEKSLRPVFIRTRNARNFDDLMEGIARDPEEGRLACVFGQAGRGKTRAVRHWHAHRESIYVRALMVWAGSSPRPMLESLALELDQPPTFSVSRLFRQVGQALRERPRPVFIDEIEKLPIRYLEVVRDLADESSCPIILVGEARLRQAMKSAERVWSRTYETLQFGDADAADVITLAREGADARVAPEAAAVFASAAHGDLRVIKRDLGHALRVASAKKLDEITPEIAQAACRAGLKG